MRATQLLYNLGQSIWLDNITRDMLDNGVLEHYIADLSITGLTSNPTIFERALRSSPLYHRAILEKAARGMIGEQLFYELAIEDLTRAADLFRPIHNRSNTVDGWVSLEVSPLLAYNAETTLAAAKDLYGRAGRPNLFIKIPGTQEGLRAIEEAIFAGIPVNVTLLFSTAQYLSAAGAFLRGIERRLEAGLNPNVASVASVFVSRWDAAVREVVPSSLRNQLGIAVAKQTYAAARTLLTSPEWQRIYNAGARPQRLLWASTGTKDSTVSEILYVKALAAPYTVNTMPEGTLKALSRRTSIGSILPRDGGDCEKVLAEFARCGVDIATLAIRLQEEGTNSFAKSWTDLLDVIAFKSKVFEFAS